MACFSSPRLHVVQEEEEVFEALTQLEISQIEQVETPRIRFSEAKVQMTSSPFATPKKVRDTPTRIQTNRNDDLLLSNIDETPTIEDRITSPLNTYRLKPISERLRSTSLSITESGTVRLEIFKNRNNIDSLVETFTVSQDGREIVVTREGTDVTNNTARFNHMRRRVYSWDNLPRKLHRKYEYTRRFVNLVKSKTPKIIMYNQQAKCMLMENFPDPNFMAKFYNGETFVSTWRGMKLVNEQQGSILSVSSPRIQQQFSTQTQQLIKFAKRCHRQCLELEGLIRSTTDDKTEAEEIFPVITGRRKSPSEINERIANQPIAVCDILNISNNSDDSSMSDSSIEDNNNSVIRKTKIPNIGDVTQLSNGEIWVEFKDGCHIRTKPSEDIFTFIDKNGVCQEYNKRRHVPDLVKCKLASITFVANHLRINL